MAWERTGFGVGVTQGELSHGQRKSLLREEGRIVPFILFVVDQVANVKHHSMAAHPQEPSLAVSYSLNTGKMPSHLQSTLAS